MRKAGAETKLGGRRNDRRYNLEEISMGGYQRLGRRWFDRPGYRQVETLFFFEVVVRQGWQPISSWYFAWVNGRCGLYCFGPKSRARYPRKLTRGGWYQR